MRITTVNQHRRWYERSRRAPYLAAYVRPSPSLARKVCDVRDTLRALDPSQIYSPWSYLHVTVKELGWLGDDVKKKTLPSILEVIRDVASEHAPFDLDVEGVGIFSDVIYGRVGRGADEIRRINTELVERLGGKVIRSKYDGRRMKPHVSIAHFTTRDVEPLLGKARELEERFMGKMRVREIKVKKWYPHRLFENRHGIRPMVVNEPLAAFELGRRPGKS
jgi:2'-5' RNA ligase